MGALIFVGMLFYIAIAGLIMVATIQQRKHISRLHYESIKTLRLVTVSKWRRRR